MVRIETLKGKKFKKARKDLVVNGRSVTQQHVADDLGCSVNMINYIENDRVIRGEIKWAYAHYLGLI